MADFFHFYGFGYDWYVFNVADVAITLGAMAILYDVLLSREVRTRIEAMRFEMQIRFEQLLRLGLVPLAGADGLPVAARRGRPQQAVARRIRRRHQGAAGHSARFQSASARAGRAADQPAAIRPAPRKSALFSNADPADRGRAACSGNYTPGEKMLLANARVQNADPAIRAAACNADQRARCRAPTTASPTSMLSTAPRPTPASRSMPMPKSTKGRKTTAAKPRKTAAAGLTGSRIALAPLRDRRVAALLPRPMPPTAPSCPSRRPQSAPAGNSTFQFALQNGMQVVVIPDHRAPVVTQMLWFKVGAVDDPPGISGLAHFFEHMMFRGTKTDAGRPVLPRPSPRMAARTTPSPTHDYTAFYEQIAKDRLPLAMELEADRMANLDLSDTNVTTERDVVLEERRMRVDNDPAGADGRADARRRCIFPIPMAGR